MNSLNITAFEYWMSLLLVTFASCVINFLILIEMKKIYLQNNEILLKLTVGMITQK